MSSIQRDNIILDKTQFDQVTHRWNVPILNIRGIKADELFIDGESIHKNKFYTKYNHLILDNTISVTEGTKAHLIIIYNPKSILLAFWLPIILAVIGVIGTLGQPILHQIGVLYTPEIEFSMNSWEYDDKTHIFMWEIDVRNLRDTDKDKWVLYAAVRINDGTVDIKQDTYNFIGGPFELDNVIKFAVNTDLSFTTKLREKTDKLKNKNVYVEGPIFKVKKGLNIKPPFIPADFTIKEVEILNAPGVSIN